MAKTVPTLEADATPAVALVLRDAQGRVLMVRRAAGRPRAGYWSPPTGKVEAGESQTEAVVREAREELGLAVTPRQQLWVCATDDGRYRLHWWEASIDGGALSPDADEVADLRWVDADGFDALSPRFDSHREFFEKILPQL